MANFKISKARRLAIFIRDNCQCVYCGKNHSNDERLTLDHYLPQSKTGKNSEKNLVSACKDCNENRGNMPVKEFCEKVAQEKNLDATKVFCTVKNAKRKKIDLDSVQIKLQQGTDFLAIMATR